MNLKLRERLAGILGEERVLTDEAMSRHTTFRIGGPADIFTIPSNERELQEILKACREENEEFFILGNGSNLLVGDRGIRGVVIQIYKGMNSIRVEGNRIYAEAGALLSGIAAAAKNASLTGFEFAAGIPGTLGGAVVMNAGAYGGELKDILIEASVLDREGNRRVIPVSELGMGYRTSVIPGSGYLVTGGVIALQSGNPEKIRETMKELAGKRMDKQPLEYPSAGSTFKRPEGYFAGKLIMDAGLRGYQSGGARVSDKHCGFVINTGSATARDVLNIIKDIQEKVFRESGVMLEPEIKMVGEF